MGPISVPVVVGLVGPVHRHADVLRLVLAHIGLNPKAQEVLNQAALLGVPEAKAALTKLLLTGSVR